MNEVIALILGITGTTVIGIINILDLKAGILKPHELFTSLLCELLLWFLMALMILP